MDAILEKVRGLVPFVGDQAQVKFVGEHEMVDGSWVKTHYWYNGWQKEGQLLLDKNGNLIGKVTHLRSIGISGVECLEAEAYYPDGDACYLLMYNIKPDNEEYALLYKLRR